MTLFVRWHTCLLDDCPAEACWPWHACHTHLPVLVYRQRLVREIPGLRTQKPVPPR